MVFRKHRIKRRRSDYTFTNKKYLASLLLMVQVLKKKDFLRIFVFLEYRQIDNSFWVKNISVFLLTERFILTKL